MRSDNPDDRGATIVLKRAKLKAIALEIL